MPRTKYPIFKCLHRGEKGFTLVELLIVIAILGILAAVIVPNVGKFMGRGTCQAYCIEKSNLQTAALAYIIDTNDTDGGNVSDLTGYYTGKLQWYVDSDAFDANGVIADAAAIPDDPQTHTACNCTGI